MNVKRLQRIIASVITCSAMLLVTNTDAIAQTDNVAGTKHNLSVLSDGDDPTSGNALVDYGEICVYCHTPHGGQEDAPLWNRNYNPGSYQMYSSPTLDMLIDTDPTGVSLACLSCHDGTIGLDVIVNAPNALQDSVPGSSSANTMPAGDTNLETDLRNDHPISIVYDLAADSAFNSVAAIELDGLKLFAGNKVQCASCHNPHNDTYEPLLRMDNDGSALCTSCHIK